MTLISLEGSRRLTKTAQKYFLHLAVLLALGACNNVNQEAPLKPPEFKKLRVLELDVAFPTNLIIANNEIWLAQLKDEHLNRVTDLQANRELIKVHALDSNGKQTPLKSPHFMAASETGVYVSEGRGSYVRFFSFDDSERGTIVNTDIEFNRPHGLCIAEDKWLYIADSVNSRLVRIDLKNGLSEIFADNQRKIAYGRQLLCRDDGVWLANSYEGAFELNPGVGSNVLRISDFASGESETIVSYPTTNVTGIAIIQDQILLVGRWTTARNIAIHDLQKNQEIGILEEYDRDLDAPYGIHVDEKNRLIYVAFLGINPHRTKGSKGAVIEYGY